MTADDHERLRELRLRALVTDPDAFGERYAGALLHPPEEWKQRAALSGDGASQRTFVLVAEPDEWLGMALVRVTDEDPGVAALNGMWVAPEIRGSRAAKLLCDACAAWAAEHDCAELILGIFTANVRARRAYEAAGFVVSEDRTWTRPDGVTFDVQRMRRELR